MGEARHCNSVCSSAERTSFADGGRQELPAQHLDLVLEEKTHDLDKPASEALTAPPHERPNTHRAMQCAHTRHDAYCNTMLVKRWWIRPSASSAVTVTSLTDTHGPGSNRRCFASPAWLGWGQQGWPAWKSSWLGPMTAMGFKLGFPHTPLTALQRTAPHLTLPTHVQSARAHAYHEWVRQQQPHGGRQHFSEERLVEVEVHFRDVSGRLAAAIPAAGGPGIEEGSRWCRPAEG